MGLRASPFPPLGGVGALEDIFDNFLTFDRPAIIIDFNWLGGFLTCPESILFDHYHNSLLDKSGGCGPIRLATGQFIVAVLTSGDFISTFSLISH